jgi:hypothetical protein
MGSHAVGHKKEPTSLTILLRIRWRKNLLGVLIIRTSATNVALLAVFDRATFAHGVFDLGRLYSNKDGCSLILNVRF